jgi:hypothetical protein
LPPRPGIWVATAPDAASGTWWDATGTPEQLRERIGAGQILDTVDFGAFHVRADESPDVIARVAAGIAEHGYAFAAWAELHDADPVMLATFQDHYLGYFSSLRELGHNLVAGRLNIPAELAPFVSIRYAALASEAIDGDRLIALPAEHGGFWLFTGPNQDNDP